MKVLYIIHATIMGGATISFKSMIEGIVAKGINPIIIYPRKQYNGVIAEFEKIGIKCFQSFICLSITTKQSNYGSYLKLIILKILSFINLLVIVGKTKPNIIHTNTL